MGQKFLGAFAVVDHETLTAATCPRNSDSGRTNLAIAHSNQTMTPNVMIFISIIRIIGSILYIRVSAGALP